MLRRALRDIHGRALPVSVGHVLGAWSRRIHGPAEWRRS
jgi:hypothetical protein